MSRVPLLCGALLGLALACPAGARAQALDLSRGGPIDVTARDGIDWIQAEQEVIARGDARAIRGNVTVTADVLIAHYRKKKTPGSPAASGSEPGKAVPVADHPAASNSPIDDTSGTEVYRLEAVGHVHIFTPTDQAWGDHAVYDMDQAVLVLTGHELKLVTPQDTLTSTDDMEYWSQKRVAIARGHAVVVTNDGRRIAADTLVGYLTPAGAAKPRRVAETPPAKPGSQDALLSSGKLEKVEAFGNVDIRTATETVRGDRGVYVPATEKARIVGHVHITRGQNQMNGVAADVDLKSGISTLLSSPAERVAGLIMPNDAKGATETGPAGAKGAGGDKKKGNTKPK
jgi:lipopolysaccharide export system protein LptA